MAVPEFLLIDPKKPLLSWTVLAVGAMVLLYLARPWARALFAALFGGLARTFRLTGQALGALSRAAWQRHRELVSEYRLKEIEHKLARQLDRLDTVMRRDLARYPELHRAITDLTGRIRDDYAASGLIEEPEASPKWATEATALSAGSEKLAVMPRIAAVPRVTPDDRPRPPRFSQRGERRRLRILGRGMRRLGPLEARLAGLDGLEERVRETVARAAELVADYRALLLSEARAVATAGDSAAVRFVVAVLFLVIAAGGSVLNFQLIARPMAELVGSGYEIAGYPIAQVAALTMILIEAAVGIVLMEGLGITQLLPVFGRLERGQRRLLAVGAAILLIGLASVEAGLAYLREILIGLEQQAVATTMGISAAQAEKATGFLPIAVQAALGFAIPFVLALVAIPLEVAVETGRAVVQGLWATLLGILGFLFRVLGQALHFVEHVLAAAYDLIVFLPLSLERLALAVARWRRNRAAA